MVQIQWHSKGRRSDIVCIAGLVALATLFLARALRPGYTLLPLGLEGGIAPWYKQLSLPNQNLLLSDPFYVFYPRRHFVFEMLQSGRLPLWMPTILNGHPLAGDVLAQVFYPPNVLAALVMSAARSLPVLAWFHLVATGVSMYLLLRLWRLHAGPALFGAVAWMLNGNMVVWLENPYRLSTLAWMPATFLAYELSLRRRRRWPVVLGGITYGLTILGGHVQFAWGIGVALGIYALFHTIMLSRDAGRLVTRPMVNVLIMGALGMALSAVQLLPLLELTALSHRPEQSLTDWLAGHWPWAHVLGLWLPDAFGHPVRYGYESYWGATNYAEVTAYFGALALPLALAVLGWSKRKAGLFFGGLFIITILVTIGTPLARLVGVLPGARYVRLQNLIAYLPFFGGAAAAYALDTFIYGNRPKPRLWGVLGLVILVLVATTMTATLLQIQDVREHWAVIRLQLLRLGLIWGVGAGALLFARRAPRTALALLVGVAALDLLQWGIIFNPVNAVTYLYPENEVTAQLRADPALYRVLPLHTDRVIFGPNVLSVLHQAETGGYSSLMVKRHQALMAALGGDEGVGWMRQNNNVVAHSRFDPRLSLLNVKYVLTTQDLSDAVVAVEAEQSTCTIAQPLDESAVQGQFVARNPGLNRIDVRFASRDESTATGDLRFRVWRDHQGGELVADVTLPGDGLPREGAYPIFFNPVANSINTPFVWSLESLEETDATLCADAEGHPAFAAYSVQLRKIDVLQGTWIYENPNALPRAFIVHNTEVVPETMTLQRLTAPEFNPWTTGLLTDPLPADQQAALEGGIGRSDSSANAVALADTVSMVDYRPQTVQLRAQLEMPGLLVLSDTFYPGWQAYVDGVPTDILRVNHTMRGLYLAPGEHEVIFRYRPMSVYIGLTLTGLALIAGGAMAWQDRPIQSRAQAYLKEQTATIRS